MSGPDPEWFRPVRRVLVRRAEPADASWYAAAVRRSRSHLAPWNPADPESLRDTVRRMDRDRGASGWTYLIIDPDGRLAAAADPDGTLAAVTEKQGLVGESTVFGVLRGRFASALIGYRSFAPYNGRGYMTEGMREVVENCFTRRAAGGLGLHRLEAVIPVGNAASVALAERLGFRREGRAVRMARFADAWHDCWRYATTAEEWPGLSRGRPADP